MGRADEQVGERRDVGRGCDTGQHLLLSQVGGERSVDRSEEREAWRAELAQALAQAVTGDDEGVWVPRARLGC